MRWIFHTSNLLFRRRNFSRPKTVIAQNEEFFAGPSFSNARILRINITVTN